MNRFLALFSLLLLVLCSCQESSLKPGSSAVSTTMSVAPPTGDHDYDQALASARKEGKKLFVEFSADWCTYCKKMERDTYSKPQVKNKLNSYIVLFLDSDKHQELANRFNVEGIPAYFIVNEKGQVDLQGDGYRAPKEFLEWLAGPSA